MNLHLVVSDIWAQTANYEWAMWIFNVSDPAIDDSIQEIKMDFLRLCELIDRAHLQDRIAKKNGIHDSGYDILAKFYFEKMRFLMSVINSRSFI